MTFSDQLAVYAVKHGRANGVLPSLILAQGILESGSGTSELATNANNLFGIKVGSGWTGPVYTKLTAEHKPDGSIYYVEAVFRKYDSYEGCVIDLVHKYTHGTGWEPFNRYAAVLDEKDYKKATAVIKEAGYATDVEYPAKLNELIEQFNLTKYDKDVINVTAVVMSSGHGKYVSGANSILVEVTEARRVVNRTSELLKQALTVYTFHDDTSKTQKDNINTIVKFHDSKSRSGDYSVHFNASAYTQKGMGVEVLYYSDKNKPHAEALSKAISDASGLKNRGAKKRTDLGFLKGVDQPAWLIEICFVDSVEDARIYKEKFEKICEAIANSIAQYNGKTLKREETKVAEQQLTAVQEKARLEAMALGITDGNDPFRPVNQYYVWNALLPIAKELAELKKKIK